MAQDGRGPDFIEALSRGLDVMRAFSADHPAMSLLRLAEVVHPTAAVGGTPREPALELITELETMDRGRYAGPVGWVDAAGDGELGVALRCAQLSGSSARLFAGCGLVAESDPDTEVAEAAAKLHEHHWPGNVRELMHVLERGAILSGDRMEIGVDEIRYRRATRE